MVKVDAVFSREGDPRRSYVQHAIVERADDVWDLIENRRAPSTCVGHGVRMKSGASMDGNNWLAGLRADGWFLEDIWGG